MDRVKTGVAGIDGTTGGMRPEELIVLAGRPATGKTTLALNILRNICMSGQGRVLYICLEMTKEAALKIIRASHSPEIDEVLDRIVISEEPSLSIHEIVSQAKHHPYQLLAIDFLGLIEPENRTDSRKLQIAQMIRSLKNAAFELRVPILCLHQLRRPDYPEKVGRPCLEDLAEFESIEENADMIMFVHRVKSTSKATDVGRDVREIIMAKQ